MALYKYEKDAYTDIWLFKPSVFGCNVNSFSLTEGCPPSLWTTAVQNSPTTPHPKSTSLEHILDKAHLPPPPPPPSPPRHSNQDHDQRIILQVHLCQGGGQGSRAFLWTKSTNEPFLRCLDNEVLSRVK